MNGDEAGQKAAKLINDLQDISFVKIALIVLGTWAIIFFVRRTFPRLAQTGPSQVRLYVLGAVPLIRLFLLVGAILWIIPIVFNITFQNFLVIAGAASVAIGFAFKDYVSSLIAGVVAIVEKPYRPGDWVKVGEDYGEVQSVGLRSIRLRTPSDDIVTAPHIRLWKENVVNGNDGARTLMCVAEFWVAPEHDAKALRAALRNVAMTSAYLDFERPVIVILSETPYGTHYRLKAYPFDMRDQFVFVSDLTVRGKAAIASVGASQVVVPAAAERQRRSDT
ncbi:mechanosensitive ion channel domain-containing protein [uncultured Jannaschia sp.]|uniref:mechanosensitive ion channel family protein n=1 Tax=uncultured Jannaschia sp. TaxID=293347 RepID=UPI002608F0D6|nr:mechanosensitive ion channel domain-containing protein [uncultured Jannaschia sp.]